MGRGSFPRRPAFAEYLAQSFHAVLVPIVFQAPRKKRTRGNFLSELVDLPWQTVDGNVL
jgi:hypothetical protein